MINADVFMMSVSLGKKFGPHECCDLAKQCVFQDLVPNTLIGIISVVEISRIGTCLHTLVHIVKRA